MKERPTRFLAILLILALIATTNTFAFAENQTAGISLTLANDSGSGKIMLSWNAVSEADQYIVYRAEEQNGEYVELVRTEETAYTDSSGEAGKTYYYRIKPIHTQMPDADYAWSAYAYRVCDIQRPNVKITNLASSGKIQISWEKTAGADQYYIYRALSKTGTYTLAAKTTANSYTDKNGKAGKAYYYKVRAVNTTVPAANSAYSKMVYRTCDMPAPVITLGSNAQTGKTTISWKKIAGADKYELYCSTQKNGTYSRIGITKNTSITHNSGKAGTGYYYKVKAIDNSIPAANSGYSTIKKKICDLPRPVLSSCTLNSKGKAVISWKKVSGANQYKIYRKTGSGGTYSLIGTTANLSYTDSAGAYEKTYYYKVKAQYPNVEGAASASSLSKNILTINPNKKMVALTFDDGPGPYTKRIVNCLTKNNGRATFFVLGQRVYFYPSATKAIHNGGNEIGNHSYSHPMLYSLSSSGVKSQMNRTDTAVYKYTGVKPKLMRPPGGGVSSLVKNSVGKPIIMWSIDTLDWKTRSKTATVNAVMQNVSDGDIVLMHDIHQPTMEAALELIPKLKAKGYQLVTVSDLAKFRGTTMKNGKMYYSF